MTAGYIINRHAALEVELRASEPGVDALEGPLLNGSGSRQTCRLESSPMAHRLCPVCKNPGRLLNDPTTESIVEFYRCDKCNKVWSYQKDVSDLPAKSVTLPKRSAD
jgi:hypothetical protein